MKLIVEVKLWCPFCGARHIDEHRNGERWDRRAHTTHRCQGCGKDFDVYVSGAPHDGVFLAPSGTAVSVYFPPHAEDNPMTIPLGDTMPLKMRCGCLTGEHPDRDCLVAGDRNHPTCPRGWSK